MSQTRTDTGGRCSACGQVNEPGMSFCVNCGQPLPVGAGTMATGTRPAAAVCPSCGRADELSQAFCLHCGASMQAGQPAVRRRTEAAAPAAIERRLRRDYKLAAAAAGVLAGAGLACLSVQLGAERIAGAGNWPRRGLVVYAQPARATVMIQDRAGRSLTAGATGPTGSLSVSDLPPGFYRVSLSAPGYRPVVQDLRLEPDKVAVLGFPRPIELEKER